MAALRALRGARRPARAPRRRHRRPPPALALAALCLLWRCPPPPPPPTRWSVPTAPRPACLPLLPLQQGQLFPSAGPGPSRISNSGCQQPHLGVGVSARTPPGFPDWSRIAPSSVRTLVPSSLFSPSPVRTPSSCPLSRISRIPVQAPGLCRRLGLQYLYAGAYPLRPESLHARTSLRSSLGLSSHPWALSSHQSLP